MARQGKYAVWYGSQAWKNRRGYQLQVEPLCRMCLERGKVVPARVADHVVPHCGDYNLFVLGKLQSLCFECHNSRKRTEELMGYSSEFDEAGWPIDPEHPTNKRLAKG